MRKLILAAVLAATLVSAPAASAKIVVGQSVAGISLGMTEQQVIATLGPAKKTTDTTDQITSQPVRELEYDSFYAQVLNGSVVYAFTISKQERTANGVGVGTKEKALKKKIKGIKCSGKKNRLCAKGSGKAGTVTTVFVMSKSKKVRGVGVGLVLD